jgi:hypothetical protein
MHFTVYMLAGYATIAWLLLIVLPAWRVTRQVARSAAFPVYLCVLYAIGVGAIIASSGAGFIRDFGSAEGVIRILARSDVALIAWIHILAFDQLVGLFIYRDNMRHRYVPLPVQSLILALTFMFGPVGFLTYWAIRAARRARHPDSRGVGILLDASDPFPDRQPALAPGRPDGPLDDRIDAMPSPVHAPVAYVRAALRSERAVALTGTLGLALAGAIGVLALVHGPVIEPEGVLSKPMSFDGALGFFVLTLAVLIPLARLPLRRLDRLRLALIAFTIISLAIETVQSLRGLDPRFSQVAGAIDQRLGLLFFFVALGVLVCFYILAVRFFEPAPRPADEDVLALSLRYGAAAAMLAFGAGIAMSAIGGRQVGASGNLIPLHALGFHGLQSLPLVAILGLRAGLDSARVRSWVHRAGLAWTGACVAVAIQTMRGLAITVPRPASIAAGLLVVTWGGIVVYMAANRNAPARVS